MCLHWIALPWVNVPTYEIASTIDVYRPREVYASTYTKMTIDTVSNLAFWSRFANKLEPWHNVYNI